MREKMIARALQVASVLVVCLSVAVSPAFAQESFAWDPFSDGSGDWVIWDSAHWAGSRLALSTGVGTSGGGAEVPQSYPTR